LNIEKRKSIENGIWLCHNCSDLIDKDDLNYPIELLETWKVKAENSAYSEISSNKHNQKSNSNFQTLFFELLNQQELLLNDLEVTKTKRRGSEIIKQEIITGRKSIKTYYNVLKSPFKKHQNWDSKLPKEKIKPECLDFFNDASDLSKYYKFNKQILLFLKLNSTDPNFEILKNIFCNKIEYFEKIMLLYYLLQSQDKDYISLVNEFNMLEEIKISDLIHEEPFGFM